MALVLANRVQETTTTTGTGTVTLAGAVAGFQSFAVVGNANTTYYTITSGTDWEVGIGTYASSGTTLARTTILSSSIGGGAITLAGTSTVFSSYPAEKVISDGYGLLPIANGGTNATTAGGALTSLGAYPAANPSGFTSNTGTVTSVNLTAGTGVSVSGGPITSSGAITVTNTAPDQVVALTGAGTTVVSGTYPNFTITSTDSAAGTVTSVGGTGTVNGITLTGTVTSSGSLTLGGTLSGVDLTTQVTGILPVANGGTGQTTYTNGQLLIGNTTGNTLTKTTLTAGTNISVTNSTGSITIAATGLMPLSAINALGNQTGSISINVAAYDTFSLTLTGNLTISSFTGLPTTPYGFTIITTQDGTGGRSITWPSGSKYAGAVAPPITTTANAVDIWNVYTYNNGSFYVVSLAVKDSR